MVAMVSSDLGRPMRPLIDERSKAASIDTFAERHDRMSPE
jgi:hypothetical protein